LGLKCVRGDRFRRFAEIDQAAHDVEARRKEALKLRIDVPLKHRRRELRHRREVDEDGIDADCRHLLRHGTTSTHVEFANASGATRFRNGLTAAS
jgi:hypothetical protein